MQLYHQHNKQKRIMGIWDSAKYPIILGGLLTLAEELQIQRTIHSVNFVDVAIVCDDVCSKLVNSEQIKKGHVTLVDNNMCDNFPIISVLKNLKGIDACYIANTFENLREFVTKRSYLTWPLINENGIPDHKYDSTLFTQLFYRKKGSIPFLSCKNDSLIWAMNFITRYCLPGIPVVVHLKNHPAQKHCSNADFDAWHEFFNNCHKQYDVTFILIGNEEVIQQIRELPNVLIAKDFNSNLSRDLALIQTSFMFMGTASGPCNMAIFSDTPYIIYKDPDHHAEEMKKELGDRDYFPFATPLQKFFRTFQTSKNLISEFNSLYDRINLKDWKMRFEKVNKNSKKLNNSIF